MPELPGVETIRLGLEKYLVGHTIKQVEVRLAKMFVGEVQMVQGAKVQAIRRRGKGLIIDLDNAYSIAAHVKMTGQFIFRKVSKETEVPNVSKGKDKNLTKSFHPKLSLPVSLPNKYTHIIFMLDNDAMLFYNDIRQFGWLRIIASDKVQETSFFKDLGLEFPVTYEDGQKYLTKALFAQFLKKANLPIKQLLMDQKRIAGIGNIYANDALWLAKIDPLRSSSSLNEEEESTLYEAVVSVLREGLKHQGASETNFFHVDGTKGEYQNHFLVYGKTGKSCKRCGTVIKRIVIGGRGTFICSHCQR